jgi:hypothetical protein
MQNFANFSRNVSLSFANMFAKKFAKFFSIEFTSFFQTNIYFLFLNFFAKNKTNFSFQRTVDKENAEKKMFVSTLGE